MTRILIVAAAVALTQPVSAQTFPPAVKEAIETARADCESFEAGDFDRAQDAIRQVDLTGDAGPDWIVDESKMSCSSAASMYCGTGGCGLTLVANGIPTYRIAGGWDIVEFGGAPVLLLSVHGSRCGGINPTPCTEALTWDPEREVFSTLAEAVENK